MLQRLEEQREEHLRKIQKRKMWEERWKRSVYELKQFQRTVSTNAILFFISSRYRFKWNQRELRNQRSIDVLLIVNSNLNIVQNPIQGRRRTYNL